MRPILGKMRHAFVHSQERPRPRGHKGISEGAVVAETGNDTSFPKCQLAGAASLRPKSAKSRCGVNRSSLDCDLSEGPPTRGASNRCAVSQFGRAGSAALNVSNDLPHLCPAEGCTGRLRSVREADLSHLLGRFLVLEKDYS